MLSVHVLDLHTWLSGQYTRYFLCLVWFCRVYSKKYAHGSCFAVLCCGHILTDLPVSIRLTSLALGQSNGCPSASKATLINMSKFIIWIHYGRLHNHNKAKHNNTVCIFLGIYCSYQCYDKFWTYNHVVNKPVSAMLQWTSINHTKSQVEIHSQYDIIFVKLVKHRIAVVLSWVQKHSSSYKAYGISMLLSRTFTLFPHSANNTIHYWMTWYKRDDIADWMVTSDIDPCGRYDTHFLALYEQIVCDLQWYTI